MTCSVLSVNMTSAGCVWVIGRLRHQIFAHTIWRILHMLLQKPSKNSFTTIKGLVFCEGSRLLRR